VFASAVVFTGHAATFLVAARAAGVDAPVSQLLPLALLAVLAMVLPSIAGWGPREGVTAWVFSAAGLGAERGAATAVAYGILVLAASLPGGIVLALAWLPRHRARLLSPRNGGSNAANSPRENDRQSGQQKGRAMSIRSESRITISSSASLVWAYVCDVGRWSEWAPTVRECWVRGGAPLQPGARVEQRAKGIFGSSRYRAQSVTAVGAPRSVAFAGPMGTSAARWGMEFEPIDDGQTEAVMWVEVDLKGLMRAIPGRVLKGRIRRVMDIEMAAIKAALESTTPGGSDSHLRPLPRARAVKSVAEPATRPRSRSTL
jgi:hypothetical protein